MIEAWIIDSATYMGKDVKPIFAFDSFDLSLSRDGIERKKWEQPRHEIFILLTFPYEHIWKTSSFAYEER